jgi:hypothetical protein
MKTYINFFTALLVLVFFSCDKWEDPYKPVPSKFTVTASATTVAATGGTVNLTIVAGSDGWWVTIPTGAWVSTTRLYGAGDYTLTFTFKANTSGVPRTVNIVVSPTFNLDPVTISITQS